MRLDVRERLVLRLARRDVAVDRDRALAIAARDRLQRRPLFFLHQRRQRHELARRRAHAQPREILGARALVGQQARADVDAPPAGRVLAGAHAADERVDRRGHVLDRTRRGRRRGRDRERCAARACRPDSRCRCRWPCRSLRASRACPSASVDQLVPLRTAHGELDREAALRGEALLREILHRPRARRDTSSAPCGSRVGDLLLRSLRARSAGPCVTKRMPVFTPPPPKPPTLPKTRSDLRLLLQERLGALEDAVGLRQVAPTAVCRRTIRRLWSCDGTNSLGSFLKTKIDAAKTSAASAQHRAADAAGRCASTRA